MGQAGSFELCRAAFLASGTGIVCELLARRMAATLQPGQRGMIEIDSLSHRFIDPLDHSLINALNHRFNDASQPTNRLEPLDLRPSLLCGATGFVALSPLGESDSWTPMESIRPQKSGRVPGSGAFFSRRGTGLRPPKGYGRSGRTALRPPRRLTGSLTCTHACLLGRVVLSMDL